MFRPAPTRCPSRTVKTMFALRAVAICLTALLVTRGARAGMPPEIAALPFKTWVSDVYLNGASAGPIIEWLDLNTVLFRGYAERPTYGNIRHLKRILFLWNIHDRAQPYAVGVWSGAYYCAANGIIAYGLPPVVDPATGKKVERVMKGPVGEEREVIIEPHRRYGPAEIEIPVNQIGKIELSDCDGPKRASRMKGRLFVTDAKRRFYLDFGENHGIGADPAPQQVTLMRADGSGRVQLPIDWNATGNPGCTYSFQFVDAFFVWHCATDANGGNYRWHESNCWPIWRISIPDGETRRFCIPFGPWVGATIRLVPTSAGFFFTSKHHSRAVTDPGAAGLYRLIDGKVDHVLAGWIENTSVSPDGCRVAFVYAPSLLAMDLEPPIWAGFRVGGPGRPQVTVIDVCAKK